MAYTLATIALPLGLLWVNEFKWNKVGQNITPTLDGSIIIEENTYVVGRPIILRGSVERGWVDRTTLLALHALSQNTGINYLLTLPDDRTFTVSFDNTDGTGAVTGEPILQKVTESDDVYQVQIKLIVVA
jgi:hypothetical protein